MKIPKSNERKLETDKKERKKKTPVTFTRNVVFVLFLRTTEKAIDEGKKNALSKRYKEKHINKIKDYKNFAIHQKIRFFFRWEKWKKGEKIKSIKKKKERDSKSAICLWLCNITGDCTIKVASFYVSYVPTFMFYFWCFIELLGERRAIRWLCYFFLGVQPKNGFFLDFPLSNSQWNIKGKNNTNKNNLR